MLALSGTATAHLSKSGQSRELSVVKLYSPYGVLLRTLKVWLGILALAAACVCVLRCDSLLLVLCLSLRIFLVYGAILVYSCPASHFVDGTTFELQVEGRIIKPRLGSKL